MFSVWLIWFLWWDNSANQCEVLSDINSMEASVSFFVVYFFFLKSNFRPLVFCYNNKFHFSVCYSLVGLVDMRPIGLQSWII